MNIKIFLYLGMVDKQVCSIVEADLVTNVTSLKHCWGEYSMEISILDILDLHG